MRFQFSIARLLMATAMVALTFGLARWMLDKEISSFVIFVSALAADSGLIVLDCAEAFRFLPHPPHHRRGAVCPLLPSRHRNAGECRTVAATGDSCRNTGGDDRFDAPSDLHQQRGGEGGRQGEGCRTPRRQRRARTAGAIIQDRPECYLPILFNLQFAMTNLQSSNKALLMPPLLAESFHEWFNRQPYCAVRGGGATSSFRAVPVPRGPAGDRPRDNARCVGTSLCRPFGAEKRLHLLRHRRRDDPLLAGVRHRKTALNDDPLLPSPFGRGCGAEADFRQGTRFHGRVARALPVLGGRWAARGPFYSSFVIAVAPRMKPFPESG